MVKRLVIIDMAIGPTSGPIGGMNLCPYCGAAVIITDYQNHISTCPFRNAPRRKQPFNRAVLYFMVLVIMFSLLMIFLSTM
jgi:hypothetical protein